MKVRRILVLSFLGLTLVFSMVRVSTPGNFGEILRQPKGENWQDYKVYWNGGPTVSQAVAILFDPKADDLTLAVDKFWSKVDDGKSLSGLVGWMKDEGKYPHVMRVVGPNKQLFGYVYTFNESMSLNVVNEKEMFVDAIVH